MLPSATIEDKDETECYKKYGGYVKHQSKIKIAVKPEYRYRATKKDERLKNQWRITTSGRVKFDSTKKTR